MRKLLLFIVAVFFSAASVNGQEFSMLHYTIDNGLPGNRIYEVYRDSKGFLWIATDKGVSRYNGIRFENFTISDGLADNDIFFFQEDRYGRLWLGTANGSLCYYSGGIFHNSKNTPFLKLSFKPSYTAYINVEYDSTVTIGFMSHPNFLNIGRDYCNCYNINNDYNNNIASLKTDSSFCFPDFYSSICMIRKAKDTGFQVYCHQKYFEIGFDSKVKNILFYDTGKSFYTTFGQNNKYLYSLIARKAYQFEMGCVFNLNGDTIWRFRKNWYKAFFNQPLLHRFYVSDSFRFVATVNGLYVNDSIVLLRQENVSSITQDGTGNYWVGTLANGLFMLHKNFLSKIEYKNQYSSGIKYVTIRHDSLFYATGNANLYVLTHGKSICLFDQDKYYRINPAVESELGFFLDSQNRYYVLYNIDCEVAENVASSNKQLKHYKNKYFVNDVKSIFANGRTLYIQSRLWVIKANFAKLSAGDEINKFRTEIKSTDKSPRIFCSAQAPDGTVWFSSRNDIYKIVGDSGVHQKQFGQLSFKSFTFSGGYLVGCTHDDILCVVSNIDKKIIIDTVLDKNCIWDKLYKIDADHILISTNNYYRLLTLHTSDKQKKYEIAAIEERIVPLHAEAICSDGNDCYFFKNGTISMVDVKTLLGSVNPPELSFSTLKVDRQIFQADTEFHVSYQDAKSITLSFSVRSFVGKEIDYEYSVSKNGVTNWTALKAEEITLVNPNYGDYKIKLRARTLSSGYSIPIVFTLHISKPYWATWWFIALSIICLGGAIVFIVWRRVLVVINRREKEHANAVKFMRSEYKALNALMNPHFIFNTLNNVQGLFNGNNKLAANEYLRIFADLIRQNMHNVSKEVIPLQKEIDLVNNYLLLEKLRFEDKLNFTVNIDPGLEVFEIMVPPLLIQPLVENSIKHGILPMESTTGFIRINVFERNGTLVVEIKDNGVGLNNSKVLPGSLHESYGLDNIRRRLEQLAIIQDKRITFDMAEQIELNGRFTVVTITMDL